MITRKIPKLAGTIGRTVLLLPALMLAPSCASHTAAQIDDTFVVIKGLCRIQFGHAGINWWLLQGSLSNVTITPEPGAQLASAVVRVFEDANGNGTFDAGENQKQFTSTTSGNGLSVSNITVSAGDVSGWNTNHVSLQVEVTDTSNHTAIHTQHL
jgi:hypothetical protein